MFLINPTVALIVIQDAVSGFTKRIRVGISVWHFFCASLEWFSIIYSMLYKDVMASKSNWKPASANPRLEPRSRVTCRSVVIPGTTISSCNSASSSSALTRWIIRTIFSTPPFETKRCLFDQELHVRFESIPALSGLFHISYEPYHINHFIWTTSSRERFFFRFRFHWFGQYMIH